MKLEETDVNSLPAYAVYKNLIPGVKVYQDTNEPANKRQERKRKLSTVKSETNGNGPTASSSPGVDGPEQKKKKKRNKKKNKKQDGASDTSPANLSSAVETSLNESTVTAPSTPSQPQKQKANGHVENGSASVENGDKATDKKSKKKNKGKQKNATEQSEGKEKNTVASENIKAKKKAEVGAAKKSKEMPTDGEAKNKKKKKKGKESSALVEVNANKTKKTKHDQADSEEAEAIPLKSLMGHRRIEDSVKHGKDMFQWLIHPVPVKKFMSEHWEKKPLHIKRSDMDPDYYKWVLSSSKLDDIMRKNVIRFGKNIDITSYTDGQRETHNPVGRAMPAAVWDYYANGCSVRFLNPQTYSRPLWRLNAILQEYFGTFVGANVYLTPPDTQGFAPHYDDIEAFILQLEGKKHWKVYKPRNPNEELPRFSSPNFSEDKDNIGEPVLDVVLEEGDLLYFPRGYIHQGKAVGEHSLHVTLSCYQLNSWGDLLKEYFSAAVDRAMATNVEFRRGLPLDYLSYMGFAHENTNKKLVVKKRKKFVKHMKKLVNELVKTNTPDAAVDQTAKKFMWDSLPPYLTEQEKATTSANDGEFMDNGHVFNRCEIDPDVEVKLVRKNCIRLLFEENTYRLYFTLENSMEYHGEEPQYVEIPEESVAAMKKLITSYPNFIKCEDLPGDMTAKLQLVADLWEKGILTTAEPLAPNAFDDEGFIVSDEEDDDDGEDIEDYDDDDDEEDDMEDQEEYSDEFDEFIDDGDIESYDDEEDGEYDDDEYGSDMFDGDDGDAMSDYSGDSQTTEDSLGLGKSYIEEVHTDDEEDAGKKTEKTAAEDDDDAEPPKLVDASPKPKTSRKSAKKQ